MACSSLAIFEQAQSAVKASPLPFGNDEKLQLYAHYKQATVGPCCGARPSALRVAECYKYDAWKALGSMDQQSARAAYVALVDRLQPGWRSQSDDSDESSLFFSIASEEEVAEQRARTPTEKLFAAATAAVRLIPAVQLRDEDRLQLYAFYKQATKGCAPAKRPPASQVQACVKYGAWVALAMLSSEQAMAGYCKLVDKIIPGWRKSMPAFLGDEKGLVQIDLLVDTELGLGISRDARGLLVEEVDTGAVTRWNAQHPEARLEVGDLILAVNGQKVELDEKPMQYAVGGRIMLHVRKHAPSPVKSVPERSSSAPPVLKPALKKPPSAEKHGAEKGKPVESSSRTWCCFRSAQLEVQPLVGPGATE